jgi:hypothetical protein
METAYNAFEARAAALRALVPDGTDKNLDRNDSFHDSSAEPLHVATLAGSSKKTLCASNRQSKCFLSPNALSGLSYANFAS